MRSELAQELEDSLGQLLLRRNRARLVDAALANGPPAVDARTYPVLSGVARLGPISAARLATEIGLDRSGTSRYADRLVTAGLLARTPDPADARVSLLGLTAAGRRAVERLRGGLTSHLAQLTAHLSERELRALIDGIRLLGGSA